MSDPNKARRTEIRLLFNAVDITDDINKYLISLSFTDNEEDKADDLQITLDDRDNIWLGDWLKSPEDKEETAEKKEETSETEYKIGTEVEFTGGSVYKSSDASTPASTRDASKCTITYLSDSKHPYHLISQDGKGVYGWVDANCVKPASA